MISPYVIEFKNGEYEVRFNSKMDATVFNNRYYIFLDRISSLFDELNIGHNCW